MNISLTTNENNDGFGKYNSTGKEVPIVTYTNNTGRSVVISSITLYLGTLATTLRKRPVGATDWSTIVTGNGQTITTYLKCNGKVSENVNVTTQVTKTRQYTWQGYEWTTPEEDLSSSYTFTFSDKPVVSSGSTVNVYIKAPSTAFPGPGKVLTFDPDRGRTGTALYSGSPPAPSSQPTVNIADVVLFNGSSTSVKVTHTGNGFERLLNPGGSWESSTSPVVFNANTYYSVTVSSYSQTTDYNYETPASPKTWSVQKSCKVKLLTPNAPTFTESSTGGFTVGSQLPLSVSTSGAGQPSGVQYKIERSVDGTSWNSGSSSTLWTLGVSSYFRAYATKTNYEGSDNSGASKRAVVFYEPRLMRTNGFVVSYQDYSDSTTSKEVVEGSVVVPGHTVKVEYSSFSKSKNLGLFNKVSYKLVDESGSLLRSGDLDNDPESEGSISILTSTDLAGKKCRVVIDCWCRYSGVDYPAHSDGSATFTSPLFLIGGQPYTELIYPYTTEDSQGRQIFYSASERPRLVFKVGNDSAMFNTGENIEDIVVELYGTPPSGNRIQLGVYKYSNEEHRQYFWSKCPSEVKPFPITETQSAVMDFRLPTRLGETNTYDFTVYCKNSALESDKVKFYFKPTPLNFMKSGSSVRETDRRQLISTALKQVTSYSILDATSTNAINYLLSSEDVDCQWQIISEDLFIQSRKNLIRNLQLLYEEVFKVSVPVSSIDFNKIDDITHNLIITADSKFQVEDSHYVPLGNYFNYVIYVLKYML